MDSQNSPIIRNNSSGSKPMYFSLAMRMIKIELPCFNGEKCKHMDIHD